LDVIVEKRLLGVHADGASTPITLRIGRPRAHPGGDWCCEASANGLTHWEGPTAFVGVDAWQALMLTIRFLQEVLTTEVTNGMSLHWDDGKTAISVEELFCLH
jgi:hypothetical protein